MRNPIKKPGWTPGLVKLTNSSNFKAKTKAKQAIVLFACWQVIPIGLADWLIKVGGLTHE